MTPKKKVNHLGDHQDSNMQMMHTTRMEQQDSLIRSSRTLNIPPNSTRHSQILTAALMSKGSAMETECSEIVDLVLVLVLLGTRGTLQVEAPKIQIPIKVSLGLVWAI